MLHPVSRSLDPIFQTKPFGDIWPFCEPVALAVLDCRIAFESPERLQAPLGFGDHQMCKVHIIEPERRVADAARFYLMQFFQEPTDKLLILFGSMRFAASYSEFVKGLPARK